MSMAIVVASRVKSVTDLIKRYQAQKEENRRRAALSKLSEAFDFYGISLEGLTDEEVETVLQHSAKVIQIIESRKRQVIDGIIAQSTNAINRE